MSVYKSIFVSDEFEGLEAGTQVQGIDGSVRVFGESAFSSLEQAVAAVNTKAVIARVASGKYDYFVADGNGNFSAAEQVVYVNFNGGSDLSYDNGEFSRSVDMAPAAYSASEQAEVISALNDLKADSGVVFTSEVPAGAVFSTVYVGSTSSFDDLGTFKGLSETVDAGNAVPNDEAFVNTSNISSIDELIEVIDHETGHLVGEAHEVSTGTIADFADGEMTILVCKESERTEEGGVYIYKGQEFTYWAASVNAAKTLAAGADCNLFIGGVGVATGTYTNPGDAIIINNETNSNIKSVTLDDQAIVFVGGASAVCKVDISRFHGAGAVAAYGMVEIDKTAIANDFTGMIGVVQNVTGNSWFVSSIEGVASASNMGNNGATVYCYHKPSYVGSGKVLEAGETLNVNLDGTGFTHMVVANDGTITRGEVQDETMHVENGAVTGTAGETAMRINITNFDTYNASPAVGLATRDGSMTGDLEITIRNSNVGRAAAFTASTAATYTYNTNITGDAQDLRYWQTSNGGTAYKKAGYFSMTVWAGNNGAEMILNGDTVYTIHDSNIAHGTMYAVYSGNGTASASTASGYNVVVNGDITANFVDNEYVNYLQVFQGRVNLNGDIVINLDNTHIDGIHGGTGYIYHDGDFIINATDSQLTYTVNAVAAEGTRTGEASISFTGTNVSDNLLNFDNITINAESSLAVNAGKSLQLAGSWTNSGEVTFDVNGRSTSVKLIDYTGTGSMTLEGYGDITLLNNTQGLELMVVDNDLYAGIAIAEVNGAKFADLASAYAAAAAGTTAAEKTVKLLVSSIDSIAGIPAGVTVEGVEGRTAVTSTVSEHLDNVTLKNIKFMASGSALRWCYLEAGNTFIIDNCEFAQGGAYGLHFDGNGKGDVIVRNSILKSWNSFAQSLNSVSVDGCIIDAGSYAMFRPYVNTTFTNCQFTEAFAGFVDLSEGSGVELFGENVVMELSGCSIIKSKDDPTVSTEYTVKDLIVREPYGDIGSTNKVGVKSNTSMIVIDPVKDGEGKYTAGSFFANTAAAIDANLATGSLSAIVGSSRGLVYELGETAAIEIHESIAGTVDVPDGVEFTVAEGISYGADAKLTGNVSYDIKDASGSVTFDGATVSGSKISNITVDGTTAFVNSNTISASTISVAGTLTNTGTLTIDPTANISAGTFSGGTGTITVDLTGFGGTSEAYLLIDAGDNAGVFGTVNFVGSDLYEAAVVGGDLYMKLAASPEIQPATENHTGMGEDDIQITAVAGETSVAGNISTDNGTVDVQNVAGSDLVVGSITADQDVTIDAAAGANDTSIGNVETNQDVSVTNGGDGTMQLGGITAGGDVSLVNNGGGDMSITGDTTVAELLEIRNETNNELSHSGKLAAKDINIYNNEANESQTGEITITQQIEAQGDISINNNSTADGQSGVIDLGTQEHTAEGGLNIVNKQDNVINGGGSAAGGDEQAANITVKEDVVIANDGHLNANITTDGTITIKNTSANTLIGVYDGTSIELNNAGGNAVDVTLTGEVVSIYDDGTGTTGGTVVNATINADVLYMGGTTVEITGGTILDSGSVIYLQYAKEEDYPATVTAGAELTISGDLTVGTAINATTFDPTTSAPVLYGTVTMDGTQTYTGDIEADTFVVAAGADVTIDNVTEGSDRFDFNTLTINGALTIDFDAQSSYSGAGAVTGAGSLKISTDGEWIVNDSVYRDFSGFTGSVSMTEAGAEITMGIGDAPTATPLAVTDSYFANGVVMTVAAGQTVNLKGADVTTGIQFTGAGTLNVFEDQTLSADNSIAVTQVSEGKTLTLTGSTFTGNITLDKDPDTDITTLKLNNAGLVVTGGITGDTDDVIEVAASAELDDDASLDAFLGAVTITPAAATLTLSGENDTAAAFYGAGTIALAADQTFSADGALDYFTGTAAVGTSELTLSGENTTAALFTGTTGTITATEDQQLTSDGALDGFAGTVAMGANALTLDGENTTAAAFTGTNAIIANADQTLSGDISGFTGTIIADLVSTATVTISGTVADTLTAAGYTVVLDDAVSHASPITVNADTTLATLNANDNDIALGSGTFTTVTSTSGDIDLSGYTVGALATVTSTAGDIKIASAQNIAVSTALDGNLAYTVTAAQTDDTADVTFAGDLTYADAMTVTAADNYFETPYKLLSAETLTFAPAFSFTLTIGDDSGVIAVDDMTMIGGTLYQLSLVGDAGVEQSLVLTAFNANSNTVFVNNTDAAWTAAVPYEAVMDTFYSDHANDKRRNIGYDAAASIDNAITYIKADETGTDAGKGWIELTENVTYSISTALGTDGNGVTDMTLRSRSTAEYAAAGNAKVTGNINAGAATTLTLQNISATGNVFGAGALNIAGTSANRFSGTNIAAGGVLDIAGGIYTARYIAGGTYNADSTGDAVVTIHGAADRTSISGTIYGGSIATGSGIAVTQNDDALVVVEADDLIYLAGNIYAAGLARSGATLTVNGDRDVVFRGVGANLNFTGRVSGAAQGGTIAGGTAALTFDDFTGKFNGSISDFDSITVRGSSALELGRRQTKTGTTAVNFELSSASVAGTSMYTVRDLNAWEFAKTISVTADTTISTGTASGTYVLVDNYAAGFDGFTFTVAGEAATIGTPVTVSGNVYTLNYQSDKLTLTFVNNWDSAVINDAGDQDAESKEFVIYNTSVNGATLANDDNVETISATEGTTVVFNDDSYSTKLDDNAAGALIYKDSTTDEIVWVGNAESATVNGNLAGSSMDISGKELTVNAADIDDLVVAQDATLNLTTGASTIDTVTMAPATNLTLDVGSGATVSGTGTGALTITGSNGTVTINNEGTLTAQVTSAGTVVITNTSTNSLYGDFGGAGTERITLDNTGKVADASFTADTVVLNDAVNATTGRLGFYQNITVNADALILNADLSGWDLAADVNFPGAIYNFADAEVSELNFTIDAGTTFGGAAAVAAVTGADLASAVFTVNGAEIALGDTVSVGGVDYAFTLFNGDAYFFQGSAPSTDKETIVVDENAVDYVIYEGKTYTVGVNAFNTVSEAMAARTEDTDTLIVIQATDSVGSYDQGHSTASLELAKVTGSLTAKNYYIGHDTEDPWEGETFNATDTLVIEAGASLLTPAVQDNTAIYVRATGEVIADEGSVIGIQPNNIVNLLNYGKVTLNGTTAYLDGFANYGVDLNDNPETLGKAEFNAINSTIYVRGTLNGSYCNQYTVQGLQTAALIGGKPGKGDATVNLTDTTMTVGTNFVVGFDKNGTLNLTGGDFTVGGTLGVGLDAGNGVITMTGADLTAGVISVGSNGSITLDTDSLITADSLTNSGSITIDAAGFEGAYKKVIDLSQASALSDINLVNAEAGVSLSYGADGDVYVVDSAALAGIFFVNADWSGKSAGDEIEVIPGVTVSYGTNAFSTLDDAFNVYGDNEHRNTETKEIRIMSDLTSTGTGKQFFYSDVDVAITADSAVSVDMSSHSRVYFMGYYDIAAYDGMPEEVPTFTIGGNVDLTAKVLMAGQAVDYQDDVDAEGNATRPAGAANVVIDGTVYMDQAYAAAYSTVNVTENGKLQARPNIQGNEQVIRASGVISVIGDGSWSTAANPQAQYAPTWISVQNGSLFVKDAYASTGTVNLTDVSAKDEPFTPDRTGDSMIVIDNSRFDMSQPMSLLYDGASVIVKNGSVLNASNTIVNNGTLDISDSTVNSAKTVTNAGTLTLDVDSVLNGAVNTSGTMNIDGILDLATDVAGSKILTGTLTDSGSAFKIEGEDGYVNATLNGEAVKIAGAGTETTDDDVWAQLSNNDGDLTVSWGRSVNEVTAAADALNAQKNDMTIGQAVVADATALSDGAQADDFTKKNNGTLA